MIRTRAKEMFEKPYEFKDKKVKICGWVRTIRDMKTFGFIEINDGSSLKSVQVVFDEKELSNFKDIAKQHVGAALSVTGMFELTEGAKQPFEVYAKEIVIEGESMAEYPLQKKRHSPEFLRSIAHLRPRTNLYSAVFRIRSVAAHALHCFFQDRGFIYVHTPIITCSDAEGAGEMFSVSTIDLENPPRNDDGSVKFGDDFFGKKAGLTVSGQLNVEAYCLAFSDVYTFGPTFRAENSNTTRHAAEFWMIEPEIAFADLNDNMRLAEDMLKYVIDKVMSTCADEYEFLSSFVDKELVDKLKATVSTDFSVVSYTDAIDILLKSGQKFVYPVSWGCDLKTEHERYLAETHFNAPVFVINYPKGIKAFYMRLNDDDKTVAAMDLLVPGVGELIGGSQREDRYDVLQTRIEESGLDNESYKWYSDLRRYGGVKHAGFGIGFERLLMYLSGVSNIRDVTPFPRTVGNADF